MRLDGMFEAWKREGGGGRANFHVGALKILILSFP